MNNLFNHLFLPSGICFAFFAHVLVFKLAFFPCSTHFRVVLNANAHYMLISINFLLIDPCAEGSPSVNYFCAAPLPAPNWLALTVNQHHIFQFFSSRLTAVAALDQT